MKEYIKILIYLLTMIGIASTGYSQSIDTISYITVWKTDNPGTSGINQITIPVTEENENYNIYWQNVSDTSINATLTATGFATITFPSSGTYRVKINGNIGGIQFYNGIVYGDPQKLIAIEQWGDIPWNNFLYAYYGCTNLNITAKDAPILASVSSFGFAFYNCISLNSSNLNLWNTSSIKAMNNMFKGATSFDQSLGNWNTSSVLNMSYMFFGATAFNQPIGAWNTTNVSTLVGMFSGAASFNQSLGSWTLASASSLIDIFQGTSIDCANYSSTLIGWATNSLTVSGIEFGGEASSLMYGTNALAARNTLLNKGWTIDGDSPNGIACISVADINFNIKALLGGDYSSIEDTMSTSLRTMSLLPVKCPYDTTVTINPLSSNMVDWVRLDLVDTLTGDTIYATQCACLLKNGSIQNIIGDTTLSFTGVTSPYISVRIKHRNHLSARSGGIANAPGVPISFDFRTGTNLYVDPTITGSAYHNVGLPEMPTSSGRYALWPGDANGDGQVKYQGSGNDRGIILSAIGGTVITNTLPGYHSADINLNGQVKYQGSSNDRGIVLSSIGGTVITKITKSHN